MNTTDFLVVLKWWGAIGFVLCFSMGLFCLIVYRHFNCIVGFGNSLLFIVLYLVGIGVISI